MELLKAELEIQLGELEEQWHFASLERIFIENRIYRDIEEEETWEPQFRPPVPSLPSEERRGNFKETELGLSEENAKQEAKRCLRCDLER